jgi:endopeptidase La
MLPIELDHRILSSLPSVDDAREAGVIRLLDQVVTRRVLPYFRTAAAVDAVTLARVSERYKIARLEDLRGRIRTVSIVTHSLAGWTIHIHEQVFDYIAFGIPWDLKTVPEPQAPEGRKAMAFAELLLRHELQHMIKPGVDERDVILADAEFAMDRRESDPSYYKTLRDALGDEMGGLKGGDYLRLLDLFEQGQNADDLVSQILQSHSERLAEIPRDLMRGAFRTMGRGTKCKVIEACYRKSRDTHFPLIQRSGFFRKALLLFIEQLKMDRDELEPLFKSFTDRWGVAVLFQEMEIQEKKYEGQEPEALFDLFVGRLKEIAAEEDAKTRAPEKKPSGKVGILTPNDALRDSPRQSLRDRVEDARTNPLVPRSVLDVIDKNQTGLKGHSAAKYTELVDTLLSVPWGKLHAIDVGPKEFATGLDTTHYGLHRPKEIITDFFSNLIWRYRKFSKAQVAEWHRTGSAFLFVGPPGVGKTSLAISIARNLGIPYHKVSLGGMRDESDLRGHGFTYEGSKPGAIVQGLVKMGVMNGMFILDEADKTEKFAIATLLEILDPEQNHLFHDKYIQTTVDVDLSNCHFILTANTLETVPEPVIDRCQVVMLNRYSVEEKVAIAREHIIPRIRKQYGLDEELMDFETGHEEEYLRELIRSYTHEAGVRQLEVTLRTLFLRLQRREIFDDGKDRVVITHRLIKRYLEEPTMPRNINDEDRVGEVLGLGVNVERGIGSIIPIQATAIRGSGADSDTRGALSMIHATGNIEKVMDESRKVATTGILYSAESLGIDPDRVGEPLHLHFMGGSTRKDGPSAGGAIGIALASFLKGSKIRRDVAITGEVDTHGRITGIGGLDVKLETAASAGCKTVIIPAENLHGPGGVERFPDALKKELQILTYEEWEGSHQTFDYNRHVLQVVAVNDITQAFRVAVINDAELDELQRQFIVHAQAIAQELHRQDKALTTCPKAVIVKEPEEIDSDYCNPLICQHCSGCRLLAPKDVLEKIVTQTPEIDPRIELVEFDSTVSDLPKILTETVLSMCPEEGRPQVAVIAPFFLLKKAGMMTAEGRPVSDIGDVRIFANNYTVQGVKLRHCKRLLNRTYCRIAHLGVKALLSAPFLSSHNGVTVVDLSWIPEKYRLLVPRAEEILNRCLAVWLETVEEALEDLEPAPDGEPVLKT